MNDTGLNDTGLNDTRLNDTGLNDTRLKDTGLNDTGLNDTGLNDTRVKSHSSVFSNLVLVFNRSRGRPPGREFSRLDPLMTMC